MGCSVSKLDNPKGGDPSQLYTRLTVMPSGRDATDRSHSWKPVLECAGRRDEHRAKGDDVDQNKRGKFDKVEACVFEESSSEEEELDDRDDDIDSFMQAPSFRVYCVPSPIDDDNSEGDSNPEETKEDQKIDVRIYDKRSSVGYGKTNGPRRERRDFRSRFCRYIYSSHHGRSIKLKGSFGRFSW